MRSVIWGGPLLGSSLATAARSALLRVTLDYCTVEAAIGNDTLGKLPVLMYVYAGGFTGGSKIQSTPEGLFALSKDFILFLLLSPLGRDRQNHGWITNLACGYKRFNGCAPQLFMVTWGLSSMGFGNVLDDHAILSARIRTIC
ncbi:hypothetical protein BP00DRAFT_446647 [Aspergillus indologenus CBS 114.80]|uniref:Carboxylesterase type B domain-containing protein n=1 Tax=Aspergillus indologenus CBS 114.80 TaxID=1450541 RepID=A0A2V5IAV3_9EURO|nr:hypothetical protein BP00DRAFT_446647 [Aspergillus indologenus CBS 114.80]